MPKLTLIGYRGTGKSTLARGLADLLGCDWRDADLVLEERVGRTIAALVRDRGEAAFRAEESAVLGELLRDFHGVIATGGGAVLDAGNRQLLKTLGRPVVWLKAPAAVIRGRLAADPTTRDRRPALAGDDPLAEVEPALLLRDPLYRECADVCIDAADAAPEELVAGLAAWLVDWDTGHGSQTRLS